MREIFRKIAVALIFILQLSLLSACGAETEKQSSEDAPTLENQAVEAGPVDEQPDYSLYIPVLETAIADRPNYGDEYGILYDLDQDGVDELFLLHSYPVQTMGYSVYDIEQGALVPKIVKQDMLMLAGGYKYFAGITDANGEVCFYAYSYQSGDRSASSSISVYGPDLSLISVLSAELKAENVPASYEFTSISYFIDGSACSEEEYLDRLSALFSFDTGCFSPKFDCHNTIGMFYNGVWYGDRIEDLLLQLKGTSESEETPSEEEPQETQASMPTDYGAFLEEERYMDYDEAWNEWSMSPSYLAISDKSYAVIDINQDGIEELIVNIKPEPDFMFSLIFTRDTDGQIVFVANLYHFSYIRYSPEHLAVECSETRPSATTGGSSDFYTLNGTELQLAFTVIGTASSAEARDYSVRYPDAGETVSISPEEGSAYFSNLQDIEWISLA